MSAHSLLGDRGRVHVDRHSPTVGALPPHRVLPEGDDGGAVVLDDVVIVLAIWGQGLGRSGHWRSRGSAPPRAVLLLLQVLNTLFNKS